MLEYLEQKLILSFSNISFSLSDRDFLHKFYAITTGSPILHGPQREREIIRQNKIYRCVLKSEIWFFFRANFLCPNQRVSKPLFPYFNIYSEFFPLYQCQANRFFFLWHRHVHKTHCTLSLSMLVFIKPPTKCFQKQ